MITYSLAGNGSAETYFDYCGVYTHEFGHVFGLTDLRIPVYPNVVSELSGCLLLIYN